MPLPWLVFRHVEIEGLGTLTSLMERKDTPYRYVDLFKGEPVPDHLDGIGGLIVMGGPMNVDEEERFPFLREENRLLRQALTQDIPILGICLGSQLIAKAAGARVHQGPQKEIGWKPVTFTEVGAVDPLFEGLGKECMAFHWHGDTFDLPDGAVHLCRSDMYRHQAFRIGTRVYAFQFHLEVDGPMIREWVSDPENQHEMVAPGSHRQRFLRGLSGTGKNVKQQATKCLSNFSTML